jgi:hypothetical protein
MTLHFQLAETAAFAYIYGKPLRVFISRIIISIMFSLRTVYPVIKLNRLVYNRLPAAYRSFTSAKMSSITASITKDHRELEQYYNEIVNSNDHDHQDRYGNQFVWELARHSVGEELIVYPAFEKYLGDEGKQMAESDRKEHHEVCTALSRGIMC